jgi:hypothetical protein
MSGSVLPNGGTIECRGVTNQNGFVFLTDTCP